MSIIHPVIKPPKESIKFGIRNRIAMQSKNQILNPLQKNVAPPETPQNSNAQNPRLKCFNQHVYIDDPRGIHHVIEVLNNENKFSCIIHRKNRNCNYVYAESQYGDKYYFEVKCKSSKSTEKKYQFSNCSIGMTNKQSKQNEHHYIAIVINIDESPFVLFYEKGSDLSK